MKLKRCLLLLVLAFCFILVLTACGDPNEGKSECELRGHQYSPMGADGKKDPTCTEDGYEKERCWVCGDEKTTEIPALGHTEVVEEAVEATCDEDGKTEKKYCSVCDEVIAESEVIPGGHVLGDQLTEHCYAPNITEDGVHYEGRVYFMCTRCEEDQAYVLPVLTDSAYTVERDGETEKYTITVEGQTVEFTKSLFTLRQEGSGEDAYFKIIGYRGDSTNIVIPAELSDPTYYNKVLPVKAIAENVFKNSTTLKSITIPASVTEISDNAFAFCEALTTVTLSEGVESIGSHAFNGCTALKTVAIPDSVSSIEEYAFSGCSALTAVTIPEAVTIINTRTFSDCTSLKSITIPAAVKSIENTAFADCSGLESVNFAADSDLEIIREYAFSGCSSLKSLVSPAPMLIGALNGCTAIESITVPNIEVTYSYCNFCVGDWFSYSTSHNRDNSFAPESLKELIVLDESEINDVMLADCKWLEKVEIRNCDDGINSGAFNGCTALKEVVIGTSERLGGGTTHATVFANCPKLEKVTLENVKTVSSRAFYNQTALKEIKLGGVEEIGDESFFNCQSLEKVFFSDTLDYIRYRTFWSCDKLEKVTLPSGMKEIGYEAFSNCPMLKEVTVGGVEAIKYQAFINCGALEKITVVDELKTIENLAFSGCTALTTVNIPSCIEYVENTAFTNCTALAVNEYENGKYIGNETDKYLVMIGYTADGLEYGERFEEFEIKDGARILLTDNDFWNYFESYTIPASVKYVYVPSEWRSVSLDINYGGTAIDWLKINFNEFNYGLLNGGTLTFSDGKTPAEITEIVLDDSFTSIGGQAYSFFENVVNVTIPATVKEYLGSTIFNEKLENVYYNGTIEDWCKLIVGYYSPMIYAEHFYMLGEDGEYYEPTVVEIPESIRDVGEQFLHFKNLTAVVIHADVYDIDNSAFDTDSDLRLYFKGTAEQWAKKRYKNWSEKLDVYFYSETKPTLEEYLENPEELVWYYNDDGEPESFKLENNVEGKTYAYSTTEVTVTETYWQLLMYMKDAGVIDQMLDSTLLEMFNSSSNKEEFASKIADFASTAAQGLAVSFADGKMTFTQNGQPVSVDYVESNGKIYVKISGSLQVFYYVDAENNCIYEYLEDYGPDGTTVLTTTKHIYSLVN